MSSPPQSLPPAASPAVTTPPPLTPSFPPLLPPLLPSPFSQPLMPPLPQIAPSSPTSTPPTLPPINNSVPPVSSPPLPPLTSPPPQLPPLPVLLPPSRVIPPPPPSATSPPPPTLVTSSPPPHSPPPSVVTSSPPPPSPPLTPLPSTPSLPPPSPPLPPPHVSPPIIPSTAPLPPALSTPTPSAPTTPTTQTPPLASPTNDSPPPALPPPLASTLQPSPSNNNSIIPPPTTLPMPPQSMLHPPLSSSLPTTLQVHNPRTNKSTALIAGSCAVGGLVAIAFLLAILFLCYNRRRSKNNSALLADPHKTPSSATKDVPLPGVHVIRVLSSSNVPQSPISRNAGSASIKSRYQFPHPPQTQRPAGSPFDFSNGIVTYDQIVVATNGFSEANLLGQGGFGYVHKGVLPSGKEVAIKQLKTGSRQGEREFQAEVAIISRVHHKHLVSLVGYCTTGVDRLLVYEFVPNNTLEFHLHGEGQPVLEWEIRLRIATGSAKGLAYLHEDCNPKIIHRDIKASNILLDHNFEAKVSDFGLAKSFSDTNTHMTHFSTQVVGTFGYLAPEYASSGKVTDKSDVYSYGVVLLELITGRRPISTSESIRNKGLVQWARPLLTQALEDGDFNALTDPRLEKNYKKNEMARMVACAAACVRHSAWLRPRMSQVVHALEGVASLTELREGITPGNSTLHNGFENAYLDISRYSETTSEYGFNLSGSSGEGQRTVWS